MPFHSSTHFTTVPNKREVPKKYSRLSNKRTASIKANSRLLVSILPKINQWKSGSRKSKNFKMAQNNNKI